MRTSMRLSDEAKEAMSGGCRTIWGRRSRSARVRKEVGSKRWDLSKSQKLKDVGWPQDQTGWNWIPDEERSIELTLILPGRDPVTFVASSFTASRDVASGKPLNTEHIDEEEPLGFVQFQLKDSMTAEQVKKFIEGLGRGEEIKKQVAAWTPADAKGNQIFPFSDPVEGEREISVSVINNYKNTGVMDSWSVALTWRAHAVR